MAGITKMKLTTKALAQLAKQPPTVDVWDTELHGFHVRATKRGLAFRLHFRTKAGERRMMTLGRYGDPLTAAEARQRARDLLASVTQGGDPKAEIDETKAEAKRQQQQTLGVYLKGPYTAFQHRKKDGKGTLRRIEKDFAGWLDKPMGSLSRADVERWQAEQEAKDTPLAFSSLKRSYDAMHAMLAHAAERKVIPVNPLSGVKLQKPAMTEEDMAVQAAQRRYLEPKEVEALFQGLDAYQDRKREQRRQSRGHGKAFLPNLDDLTYVDHVVPWVLTMYYTGFRPGDLFGLRWEHVNLDFRTIRKVIEKTAHHHPEPMSFPLSSAASDVLKTWHRQQGQPKTGLVFPSARNGKRMSQTAMQRPWANVRQLAGLPHDLLLYSLRHNFASQLVMAGVDLLTVSKLMSHSDIQTTIAHYSHLAPDHKRDAVETFARTARKQGSATGNDTPLTVV
ncbi:site-specific integrase [Halomonas sp. CS7]|uniref:Site-specific integrase n=1 Tax=Halomonas pelophila TaxID=3151122 RepID=A0ABV1N7J7_9GAMM